MFTNEDITKMSLEFADAYTEFINEIDRVANKYGIPCKIAREIAYAVFQEVDIDETDNS